MDVEVTVRQGRLRGRITDGVAAFRGIPYAPAPVGDALYRPPGAPPAWDGVRDAAEFGPTAPKPPYRPPFDALLGDPDIPGDEFLNLNVWTPDPAGAGLPVLVWIHGGAFRNGSGAVPTYDGHAFARDGVVLVSLNYRLGVPGFALFPDAPANLGLRDQLAALAWVRDNIAAFGGDPDRVTVAGESAGAMSVATLMALPQSRGLFRRAVTQSGACQGTVTADDARLVLAETAKTLGVEPTARAFAAVPMDQLIAAQDTIGRNLAVTRDAARFGKSVVAAAMAYPPVVDGEFLERPPLELIAEGAGGDVTLLTGTTTEEQRFFLVPTGITRFLDARALTAMAGEKLAAAYTANRPDASPGDVGSALLTDRYFRIPAIRMAELRDGGPAPTYMYEFAWGTEVAGLGACHALELGFVFDTLGHPSTAGMTGDAPQDLARRMHAAWVAFATDGDPGWAPYDLDKRPVMVFDDPEQGVVDDPRGDERGLWVSAPDR
ncbi:Carboxylesterase [Streptomyces sp. RB5]|uniref:Carboxylic ester hydrolase n=1 Tax=Streptomyces smaragdinus TaxID=2585196 RepID=A0A7K0CMS5_9ACTN|nr:carboxylesterase family protein [Streptomyces smaragdinus]MQY14785.1 Carboxylesterase [Streptomyces smaragdinus]